MHVKIRYEKLKDQELIYKLISEAFDTSNEEKLVRLLHTDHQSLISLVAETDDSSIIGQAIISKMTAEKDETLKIYALAPMSVAPKYQHQGIGSKLIEAIIKEAKKIILMQYLS